MAFCSLRGGFIISSPTGVVGDLEWLKKLIPICFLISVAFGVTILPWLIRNYLVFNAVSPAGTLASYALLRNTNNFNTERWQTVVPRRGELKGMVEKELQPRGQILKGKMPAEIDQNYWQLAFTRIKVHLDKYLISLRYHLFSDTG